MSTYARTHSTHARTHASMHPRAPVSLRRSTLHLLDFRQMSCLKRHTRTQLARLAGTHAGTRARRHAHASTQSHSHAVTHVQTARGRTHARANARTHAHLHYVHVYARVTAQHEQIPTGTFQLGKNRATVTEAKRTRAGGCATADALRRDPTGVQDGGACCDGRRFAVDRCR